MGCRSIHKRGTRISSECSTIAAHNIIFGFEFGIDPFCKFRRKMTRQFTMGALSLLICGLCLQQASAFSLSMSSAAVGAGKTAVIAGATGYIGKSVVRDSVRQGYKTIALVRDKSKVESPEGKLSFGQFFEGAEIVECDVTNPEELTKTMESIKSDSGDIDAIVSCLASRSGVKKDSFAIDYQATKNCLDSGIATGARHFVLLSAFCCKNPILQFQKAKLKFEADLANQDSMTYTIVRPTAFFKSVSGQLEVIQSGAPFVMFGDGEVTRCNPIAEADLAQYLMDSVVDKSRLNKNIDLGGPDEPLTMLKQGEVSTCIEIPRIPIGKIRTICSHIIFAFFASSCASLSCNH